MIAAIRRKDKEKARADLAKTMLTDYGDVLQNLSIANAAPPAIANQVPVPPETKDAGPNVKLEAAPNGYVEALAQHLRNLDLAINELVHHHGRVSRALNG